MRDAVPFHLEIFDDLESLSHAAADWVVRACAEPDDAFAVALSGGATPRTLYELLAAAPCRDRFPWVRAHWFWGDERFVPHTNPRSNYRLAWDTMLSRAPVPAANIHPVSTEDITPNAAAALYDRALKTFYGTERFESGRPLFHVNLLGLGEDGHTASLFPGSPVLNERTPWAVAVTGAQPEPRVTLTYPALESSRHTAFLVSGPQKAAALRRLLACDPSIPAANLHPGGDVRIFADKAAAGTAI